LLRERQIGRNGERRDVVAALGEFVELLRAQRTRRRVEARDDVQQFLLALEVREPDLFQVAAHELKVGRLCANRGQLAVGVDRISTKFYLRHDRSCFLRWWIGYARLRFASGDRAGCSRARANDWP